jgi:hypothetical protein
MKKENLKEGLQKRMSIIKTIDLMDYFAGQYLNGYIASEGNEPPKIVALSAYNYADEMIKARNVLLFGGKVK